MLVVRPPLGCRNQKLLVKWAGELDDVDEPVFLDLHGRGANDTVMEALAGWPGLVHVERLDLSCNRFSGVGAALVLGKVAATAREVELSMNGRMREEALAPFAAQWPKLRSLRMRHTKARKGLKYLTDLVAPRLDVLDVGDAGFGAVGMNALSRSSILPQLKRLFLDDGDPGASGFKAFESVLPHLQLEELHLGKRSPPPGFLDKLLGALPSLRSLGLLIDNDDDLRALNGAPLTALELETRNVVGLTDLPRIRRWRLTGHRLDGIKGEIMAPWYRNLEAITLRINLAVDRGRDFFTQLVESPPPKLRLLDSSRCDAWLHRGLEDLAKSPLVGQLLALGTVDSGSRELIDVLSQATRLQALAVTGDFNVGALLRAISAHDNLEVVRLGVYPLTEAKLADFDAHGDLDEMLRIELALNAVAAQSVTRLSTALGARLQHQRGEFLDEAFSVDFTALA